MSDQTDLLVVGGGPAGLSAARGFREAGGTGRVVLVSADPYPPYARPPLTKEYLRGDAGADDLPLVPTDWYDDQRVELRLATTVTQLCPDRHSIRLADGSTIEYGALVLATGSTPVPLPVPGADHPGLVYVRDRESGEALRDIAESRGTVVVVGSGFIGCEAAASFAQRGSSVVLVTDESLPHARRLGETAGRRIADWLLASGVDLVPDEGVRAIVRFDDGSWRIELASGRTLSADHVVIGGGARPDLGLAEVAGLRVENGGVVTDAELRTSTIDVWAAGDLAHAHNPAAARALRVEHWGEAEAMGEIAGANAAGAHRRWQQVPGFWSSIGDHVLKYAAWGDGHDEDVLVEGPAGWAVWYARETVLVGVLTNDWDEAYEHGRELIERGAALGEVMEPSLPR